MSLRSGDRQREHLRPDRIRRGAVSRDRPAEIAGLPEVEGEVRPEMEQEPVGAQIAVHGLGVGSQEDLRSQRLENANDDLLRAPQILDELVPRDAAQAKL